MAPLPALKFGRIDSGYRLRVEGRGTMQQSRAAEAFVTTALSDSQAIVVIDLEDCAYLDSTFLGCLMGLRRAHGDQRLRIAAPPAVAAKLFGPTRLDKVLHVGHELPPILDEWEDIAPEVVQSREMVTHIMECHRRLAEVPGPQQPAFSAIAEQMQRELN